MQVASLGRRPSLSRPAALGERFGGPLSLTGDRTLELPPPPPPALLGPHSAHAHLMPNQHFLCSALLLCQVPCAYFSYYIT